MYPSVAVPSEDEGFSRRGTSVESSDHNHVTVNGHVYSESIYLGRNRRRKYRRLGPRFTDALEHIRLPRRAARRVHIGSTRNESIAVDIHRPTEVGVETDGRPEQFCLLDPLRADSFEYVGCAGLGLAVGVRSKHGVVAADGDAKPEKVQTERIIAGRQLGHLTRNLRRRGR